MHFYNNKKNKHDKCITANLKNQTNIEKYRIAAYTILRNILHLKIKNDYIKDHDNRVKIIG